MKEFRKLHIIKHALEMYVKRPNVDEKDLAQENKLLEETNIKISNLKNE